MQNPNPKADRQIYEIFVRTSPQQLWTALTDGKITPQYFFGTALKSALEPGKPIEYVMPDGTPVVTGTVLECDPGKCLVQTWKILYDPTLSDEISTVRWLVEPRGKATKLTVTHELAGAPKTADNVGPGSDGWNVVLSGLKTLLETGSPLELAQSA